MFTKCVQNSGGTNIIVQQELKNIACTTNATPFQALTVEKDSQMLTAYFHNNSGWHHLGLLINGTQVFDIFMGGNHYTYIQLEQLHKNDVISIFGHGSNGNKNGACDITLYDVG